MAIAADSDRRLWTLPLARAAIAAVAGCVVTFSPDHGPAFGLALFGGFALATGAASLALGLSRWSGRARPPALAAAVLTLLAGVAALLALPVATLLSFVALVAGWALLSGFFEFSSGRRGQGLTGRDAVIVGIGTMLLGAAFGLLPPHPVVTVGLLGAYAVMVAVYLGIAAFSLKWATGASTGHGPVAPTTPTSGGDR
ncbi:hypothetical protein C5C31_14480 [Rathayibacter rathayi]|uniref:HdeD family acid-resistance protein n=1 Tax=Rathayibacter rathayi TaxID=33887 RepID=A0ABD6W655_RATRA|nr:DUF308 domain-containing protein [Rathayibacter rathayi]AZZ50299.1 hypothetical protein C1O28_14745 [Rathayibacter rathayi]MWV75012.1 hypothetical protein [Rathayibacter rathayi NCPPB 2980 = VKM Ac-1601]PPF11521.1 hypothetical protein C5C04_12065 [Rathayibacter rathayi]PPF47727.1 hypothetical protein C5C08_10825 [Rathayibacter rathayi]PPF74081.1 hypothetical protein C5C14_15560 [Rathayibacter rathayi]